jgi:hypothetical protein
VGLELPAALTEPLSWVGLTWPQADEELLFQAGQQWIAYGLRLQQLAQRADQAAAQVWSGNEGEAVDAFRAWWARPDGPQLRLAEDAAAAQTIGAALIVFAVITLAMKVAFIVQLTILLIEVAQALATAVATLGATTAEVPGFIAATRVICRQIIKKVVTHIQTVIKDLLRKAKNLLKKVESRAGRGLRRLEGRVNAPGAGHGHLPGDLTDDLRRVNPHFDPADTRWSANCTHCASAYELRRRGIDAEALPLPDRYFNQGMLGRPTTDMPNAWGFKYAKASQADVVKELEAAGPGARGFVRIIWDRGGAHVFNAENIGGKVHFLDAQSNITDASRYFGRGSTFFVRSDTLPTPGSSLDDFVKITS